MSNSDLQDFVNAALADLRTEMYARLAALEAAPVASAPVAASTARQATPEELASGN